MGGRFPARERRKPVHLQDDAATAMAPQPRAAKRARFTPQDFDSDSDDDGAAAGLVQLRQQAGCEPGRASQDAAAAQAALAAGGPTTRTLGGMPFSWKLHTGKHALLWLRPYHLSAA